MSVDVDKQVPRLGELKYSWKESILERVSTADCERSKSKVSDATDE